MCWFCDDIKKFINKCVVVYDNTTANASKEYYHFYSDDTVTLKITAGGYRGNSHILTGMRELNGLKYCPNCGEKIEDFDNCASKENDKISCKIEKLKRGIEDLKKDLENDRQMISDIANLYERLAKGGIECSMTVDDKNNIRTIYCHGIELADDSERINKSSVNVFEEEENDQ